MKKTISLFLSFILLLSTIVIPVSAEEQNNVTVYVTLSQYGEILSGKDGTMIVSVPVELFGKSNYELDDAFIKIHEDYYDGDDVQWYIDNFGKKQFTEIVKQNNLIDIDKLAEAIVDADGPANSLARYDGDEISLDCGYYCYRTN